MILIDSHCHLDFLDFTEDLDVVLDHARSKGIKKILTICTQVEKFDQVLNIANKYEDVYCSVGTHPHYAASESSISLEQLVKCAKHPKVIAIGESGLDYHYENSPSEIQKNVFLKHIEAAHQTGLPLIIHARSADADVIEILTQEMAKKAFSAVLHCFSSSHKLAITGIKLGFYISFSGIITFKNASNLREIAQEIPKDRILVETDAPYLAPIPHRGKRNEPAYVSHTATYLAYLLKMNPTQFANQTTENFFRLFDKVPRELSHS